MKKPLLIIAISLFWIWACQSDENKGSYWLDKDYDFILGMLVPDEQREYPTEVFVGRLIDYNAVVENGPDSTLKVHEIGIQEKFHREQVWFYQQEYLAPMLINNDAHVVIRSENQEVTLTSVGGGGYRDIHDELRIQSGKTYSLEVIMPNGRVYTAQTKVPAQATVDNFETGDTLQAYLLKPTRNAPSCEKWMYGQLNPAEGALLYRQRHVSERRPYDTITFHAFDFSTDTLFSVAALVDVDSPDTYISYDYRLMAMDTALSHGYISTGGTLTFPVLVFFEANLYDGIRKRSNINGGKSVAGTFGSYSLFHSNFVIHALTDSCHCTRGYGCN